MGNIRHCKEDALNAREFEHLLEGAYQIPTPRDFDARFVILLAGRLGLRGGEIAHMKESWINWRKQRIEIPRYERCEKGQDGGICGYCKQQCLQMAEADTPTTYEEAKETMWSPKNENAARKIPFDASTRAAIMVDRYFERFDEYPFCRQAINRRVNSATKRAPQLRLKRVYPHALRATAATFWAGKGLDIFALQGMMGWEMLETAQAYIQNSGEHTARKMRQLG